MTSARPGSSPPLSRATAATGGKLGSVVANRESQRNLIKLLRLSVSNRVTSIPGARALETGGTRSDNQNLDREHRQLLGCGSFLEPERRSAEGRSSYYRLWRTQN